MEYIPVLSASGQRLMPCHAARARQLIRKGKAIKKHDRGLVYLVLVAHTGGTTQPMALGIDPGSKKEAFVVQSKQHTLLNVQADAIACGDPPSSPHLKLGVSGRRLDNDDDPSQVRHRAACEAIAARYPWLAEECTRQIKRRAQQ